MAKTKTITEKEIINTPAGGVLIGKDKEGQTIIPNDGSMGGFLVGRLHKNGGIKAVVKGTGQPIEMQSNEVVITSPAVADTRKREFEGEMRTNREILSKINSDAGGVKFDEGGEIKQKNKTTNYITYKDKYNRKYNYEKGTSHDLEQISKDTEISLKGLQQIYNKGIGAYKTNPSSVRPNVKSKEQWAMARVYSAVMGGKASKVDANELKMNEGGHLSTGSSLTKIAKMHNVSINLINEELSKGLEVEKEHFSDYNERFKVVKDHLIENPKYYTILKSVGLKNGGLIAPNGEESNLTAEQYKLVRTPQFKEWFGDWENDAENSSKVVDENGEPLVVYHTTDVDFSVFNKKKSKEGFFFSANKERLSAYNKIKVISVFLSIKNPSSDEFEKKGFDGIMDFGNKKNKDVRFLYEIIAFEPNQIKLADGINTEFSLNNDDIRYDIGGKVGNQSLLKDAKSGNNPARDLNNYNDLMDVQADGEVGGENGIDMDGATAFGNGGDIDFLNDVDKIFAEGGNTGLPIVNYITITGVGASRYDNLKNAKFFNLDRLRYELQEAYESNEQYGSYIYVIPNDDFSKKFGIQFTKAKNTVKNYNPITGKNADVIKQLKKRYPISYNKFNWEDFIGGKNSSASMPTTKTEAKNESVPANKKEETKEEQPIRNFELEKKYLTQRINGLSSELDLKRPILANDEIAFYQREINKFVSKLRVVSNDEMELKPVQARINGVYKVKWGDYSKEYIQTDVLSINGIKSELTFEEYLTVRTPEFMSFFGNWEQAYFDNTYSGVSKIINQKTKEPMPVFHGTNVLFTEWKTYETNNAHYFAVKREMSDFFATSWENRSDKAGVDSKAIKSLNPNTGTFLYRCFLDIRNPIDFSKFGVEKRPIREFLLFLKINYNIGDYDFWTNVGKASGFTNETKVYAWQIIRLWQNFTKYVKSFTTYDGYIFYEYIPDTPFGGLDNASLSFCAFESNQVKFSDAYEFNALSNDSRFDFGGTL